MWVKEWRKACDNCTALPLDEISENETRKDFSKAERIDYARRLERVESLKARENSLNNLKQNSECQNSVDRLGRTDEIIAEKLEFGSRDTYRKEKFIVENQSSLTPEEFSEWDEGKLSTNKAFLKIRQANEDFIPFLFIPA